MYHSAFQMHLKDLDVVVVDDSKAMQHLLRTMLLAMGVHSVRSFDDAERALASARSEPPNLFLIDCQMRPVNGFQLLTKLRNFQERLLWNTPVLVVTAHGTSQVVQRAVLAGAHHVVVKPISPKALYEKIRFVLQDDREMSVKEDGTVLIDGVAEAIHAQQQRRQQLFLGCQALDPVMTVHQMEERYELIFGQPSDAEMEPTVTEADLIEDVKRADTGPAFGIKKRRARNSRLVRRQEERVAT